jgi:hypothetical protein
MDIFTELFEYQRELRVTICRRCTIAIPPSQIIGTTNRRQDVANAALTLPDIAWRAVDERIPKPAEETVTSLGGVEDAFTCAFAGC